MKRFRSLILTVAVMLGICGVARATTINFSDSYGAGSFTYSTNANGCRTAYLYAYNNQGFIAQIYNTPGYSGGVCFPFAGAGVNLYDPNTQESTYLFLDATNTVRLFNSSGFPNANLIWQVPTEYGDHSTGPDFYFEIVTASGQEKTIFSLYDVVYTAMPYGLGYVEAAGDWLAGN